MPFGIGATEIIILLVVALIVFGPKRLPEMGRSLGRGMREFKDSIQGKDDDAVEERAARARHADRRERARRDGTRARLRLGRRRGTRSPAAAPRAR